MTGDEIEAALAALVAQVREDVAQEGRPVVRLTLKVRYKPFFTKTFSRTLKAPTTDAALLLTESLTLVRKREPGRAVRLLGLRMEMTPPDDAAPPDPDPSPLHG